MAWPLATAVVSTCSFSPASDWRSVGEKDFDGISSRATIPLESMACPVVPAGMSVLATTADILTGAATLAPVDACLLAPSTLANAIALPAMNSMTPIMTSMSVCFFTETSPSQQTDNDPATRDEVRWPLAPLEGTTGGVRRT